MNVIFPCVLLSWISVSNGANILAILPVASFSHQQFHRVYTLELHKQGHNLTVATPNPIKDPTMKNYREIDLSYLYEVFQKLMDVSSAAGKKNRIIAEASFILYWKIITESCHKILSNPELMNIYKNNEKFDLLVLEWGAHSCFLPFEKLSNGKIVGISSFALPAMSQSVLGGAPNPAVVPDIGLEYSDRMTFFQRLRSTIYYWSSILFMLLLRREETKITRQYFGSDTQSAMELGKKISLVFDNSHVMLNYPRAEILNVVPIGGPAFHLNGRKPKPLPKDIKDFLDDAPDGVVYFSLGTNVKTSNISSREEEILIESFSRIKQKVLWKWENENLKVNLKNVKKSKWFPQVDVLAHPNVKAFVSQAGLQSVGEAIEFNVPMIVMPFFADQNHNAKKMELEGAAIYLDFDTLDVPTFTQAINEVVYNPKYKENIKRLSALVKDQPIPPLEKAVWWTEYVLRHNGAPHLRSAAVYMPWYQYLNLDVAAVVVGVLILILYIFYRIIYSLFQIFFKTKKPKTENNKKIN